MNDPLVLLCRLSFLQKWRKSAERLVSEGLHGCKRMKYGSTLLQSLVQGSRVAGDPPLMEDGSMSMNKRVRNLKFSQAYIKKRRAGEYEGIVKEYEEGIKKYEGNIKKYEGIMRKYEGIMKKYDRNMKKYAGIMKAWAFQF